MVSLSDSLGSLAKSAGLMMAGSLFGRSLGLLGETLIVRQLQPELYGQIALAYSIVTMLGNVALLGVHEGVTRLTSAEDSGPERMEIILAGTITATLSGGVGIVLLIVFSGSIAQFASNPGLTKYLVLVAPYLLLFPLSRIVISVLRAQKRTAVAVLTRALIARLLPLGLLAIAIILGLQASIAAIYWLSVPLVIILVGGILMLKESNISNFRSPRFGSFTNLWQFSWPLAMSSVVFLLLSQLDVLMIGYFLESKDVGYYRAIQPLRQSATIFLGSFSFLFLPIATQYYENGKLDGMDHLFTSVTKWAVVLTLPIVLVFVFLSDEVVTILYGTAYREAALPLAILSGGLFMRALVGPNGDVVKAIDETRIELYAGVLGIIANFTLNIALIARYGIAGAAIATVCGYAVYNGIELGLIYKRTGISPFSINIAKPIAMTLAIIWVVHWWISFDPNIYNVFLFGVFSAVVTPLSVIFTKSVEETDLMLINKLEDRTGRTFKTVNRALLFGRK